MSYNQDEIYSVDTEGRVFTGYDKPVREFYATLEDDDTASVADKLTLADAMIARWTAYKEMVGK